jgi:hypothetical protein
VVPFIPNLLVVRSLAINRKNLFLWNIRSNTVEVANSRVICCEGRSVERVVLLLAWPARVISQHAALALKYLYAMTFVVSVAV